MTRLAGVAGLTALFLASACEAAHGRPAGVALFKPGTYTGEADSVGGLLAVELVFSARAITGAAVVFHNDTASRPEVALALEEIPRAIVLAQSAETDAVSGATITSRRIMDAAKACVEQAALK